MSLPPFVLVHGAWGGAWIWRRVLAPLRAAGHEVHAVTLTGDGERWPGHHRCGRSPAGAPRRAGAVHQLIYVDAMVPLPGEGWGQQHDPAVVAARTAQAAANADALPPPDPMDFGLTGADRDWLLRRQVPHPFGPYRDPLDFDLARWMATRRAFIDCTQPALPTIAPSRVRVRELPGFELRELRTGHCPMVSTAPELAQMLLELARR